MENNAQGATPTVTQPATGTPAVTPAATSGATPNPTPTSSDTLAEMREMRSQLDSANARIRELNSENKKYRLLQESLTALGVTPETLKDGLKELESFKALGTPDELAQKIERAKRADELEREADVRQACALAGIDYNDLSTRKGVDDWKFEIKTEERDGQSVKVPYATFQNGDKEESKPLLEHATSVFPTLARTENARSENVRSESQTTSTGGMQNGVWVNQDAGGARRENNTPSVVKPASYSM